MVASYSTRQLEDLRKGMKIAASSWATKFVQQMSLTEARDRLQARGIVPTGKNRDQKHKLVERLSEEKFILEASDMFMWSTQRVTTLSRKLELQCVVDCNDEDKKTLIYNILMVLPTVQYRVTPTGCITICIGTKINKDAQ